jgi:hypothetical protein
MINGKPLRTRPDMAGALNPRWARDGRIAIGQQFGSWTVLSAELLVRNAALYVMARCACGLEREANLRFMETGRSVQCKACATRQRHAKQAHFAVTTAAHRRVQKRVNAWFQRCNNPKDRSYKNYGGRGIECRFASVREAADWVLAHLPHPTYLALDLDRINNDGHYEPGNVRLVTRKANLANRRLSASTTCKTAGPVTGSPPTG